MNRPRTTEKLEENIRAVCAATTPVNFSRVRGSLIHRNHMCK
jgi:hypothetical protein